MTLSKINPPKLPPANDFKTTFLSTRGAVLLVEHALALPIGHPVRATIQNLLDRRETYGVPFDPDAPASVTRDELIGLLVDKTPVEAYDAIMARLDVTFDDLAGADTATVMAEAA